MTARRIRFAAQLRDAPSGRDWVATAQRLESLGYSALSMPDHLWTQFAPIPGLAAAATTTQSVRITMSVLANDFRNPVLLAKEAATLDVLSDGRLDLGLGAGWRQREYEQLGIPFDSPGTRIARLTEAVTIIKRLLTGERVTHHGPFYDVDDYQLTPLPVQRPRPRIVLGGGAPKMLAMAAQHADIVSIATDNRNRTGTGIGQNSNATLAAVEQATAWIAAAAPEREGDLELNLRVLYTRVGTDRATAAATAAAEFGLAADELVRSPFCAVGTTSEIADQFRRVRDELGVSYFTVSAGDAEVLAPVVAELTGT